MSDQSEPRADFKKLKASITLERVLREMLGITTFKDEKDELRCVCPLCGVSGKGKRAFAANKTKNTFYCHACHKGGDIITLVALKENCSLAVAGIRLRDFYQIDAPQPQGGEPIRTKVEGADAGDIDPEAARFLEYLTDPW